jgi:deazaflavin-dependent oxidoreductase (nitroreductase family)
MRSSKLSKRRRARRSRRMQGYLLLTLILVLYVNRERVLNQVRFFNRRFFNPLALRFAGHEGGAVAVVQHAGRRSGKLYRTPVVAHPTNDGFVIPLPYGTKVDWLCNVLAAGSGTVTWNGHDYPFVEPTEIDPATAQKLLPPAAWRVFHLFGISHFLQVRCPSEAPITAAPRPEPVSV